ncbi:unnamed protein product [Meganyctiphanes norvegica]|uniref:MYND-type domain-containing protein n=1 Tax=Meganyctiphanes norvegica TaxID=48144 RepID=A0AAV2PXK0_MEGNR
MVTEEISDKEKLNSMSEEGESLKGGTDGTAMSINTAPQQQPADVGSCATCSEFAETRCTGCKIVFYCSRDCQKKGWNMHKDSCRPFAISRSKELGKHLIASRDLDVDTIIVTEAPLVLAPKQVSEPLCLGCYKKVSGDYRCSKCKWPLCSNECEGKPYHQMECEVTKKAGVNIIIEDFNKPHPLYELIAPIRCLVTASNDPKKWRICVERYNNRYLQLVGGPQYQHNHTNIVQTLRNTFKIHLDTKLDGSEASIHTAVGIMQTNHVPTKLPYAELQALFPMASLVSHSCYPNTKSVWNKEKNCITLQTTDPIKRGQPITALYTDILWGTRARREHLRQLRLFTCYCNRCADSTELGTYFSALRCPHCPSPTPVLSVRPLDEEAPWSCTNCSYEVSDEEVIRINLILGMEVEEALCKPSIPSLEKLKKEWQKRVHKNHYHLHAVKHSLLQLYGRAKEKTEEKNEEDYKELEKKEKICKEFLMVCSSLDPSTAHTVSYVGLTFYEYHKTILQFAKRNFTLSKLTTSQLKKRLLLSKALLKKSMEIFKNEPQDTPEGQLYNTCMEETIAIGKWMLAVGLV